MGAADVSIVVVTWECAGHLPALLDSVDSRLGGDVELVVVDNDSADDPESVLRDRDRPGQVRFSQMGENAGFGAAANAGLELACGDAVVFLNPDTQLLDSGLLDLARFALERNCLAGPRLLGATGDAQPSAAGSPVGFWPWFGALVPGAVQPLLLRRRTEPWRLGSSTRVCWLSGACIAGPRQTLARLGPFDPTIHMYAEDMDLGLRAAAAGVESWFCPELARVVHRRRASSERRWPEGPERVAAVNRRAVVRAAFGRSAERRAWRAERTRLRLRLLAKRALRRPAAAESRELAALRGAP